MKPRMVSIGKARLVLAHDRSAKARPRMMTGLGFREVRVPFTNWVLAVYHTERIKADPAYMKLVTKDDTKGTPT